ncbi:universal stress protein [Rhodococcus sp. ARC_M12]|uniref:universal stress protein n=1 Tax=unclassified Rhodococcus (in: high G+C Gram-positive bacteria) TaxID=192944 RepID=UPI001FB1F30A|nr:MULTISPECIES: universal stress protein [unclassified Rhodococcus (in: high G+C Gram-positive bacteria)]MCJ0891974.1 universal stress protein [Rhodococcus sp. ARC_M5]MCJ0980131.1 universal stress protein [Rhodococcus sp. ARC_M12]
MGIFHTVVGVDGSAASMDAVRWAVLDAELHGSDLTIVSAVPTVLTGLDALPEQTSAHLRFETNRILDEAMSIARPTGSAVSAIAVDAVLSDRPAAAILLEMSETARMVVIGTRGLGAAQRTSLGSVSVALSTHSHCPVTVVHAWPTGGYTQSEAVVVGVDGTSAATAAVELAFEEADVRGAPLTAVHAWADSDLSIGMSVPGLEWAVHRPEADDVLASALDDCAQRHPTVPLRHVTVRDRPAHALLDHAQGAQLLVLGSHGRGGFAGMMLGSTSRSVVARASCPVTVVPSAARIGTTARS